MLYNPQQIRPKLEVDKRPISEAEERSPGKLAGVQRQHISTIRRGRGSRNRLQFCIALAHDARQLPSCRCHVNCARLLWQSHHSDNSGLYIGMVLRAWNLTDFRCPVRLVNAAGFEDPMVGHRTGPSRWLQPSIPARGPSTLPSGVRSAARASAGFASAPLFSRDATAPADAPEASAEFAIRTFSRPSPLGAFSNGAAGLTRPRHGSQRQSDNLRRVGVLLRSA